MDCRPAISVASRSTRTARAATLFMPRCRLKGPAVVVALAAVALERPMSQRLRQAARRVGLPAAALAVVDVQVAPAAVAAVVVPVVAAPWPPILHRRRRHRTLRRRLRSA